MKNREIDGFEGYYEVTSIGEVLSKKRIVLATRPKGKVGFKVKERKLKFTLVKGYSSVALRRDNIHPRFYVHRLVANAFIPNPLNLPMVNHKNGIKTDNRVDNLEWCTAKENNTHGRETGLIPYRPIQKLTVEQVREIKKSRSLYTHQQIADKYKVSRALITKIYMGKIWKGI